MSGRCSTSASVTKSSVAPRSAWATFRQAASEAEASGQAKRAKAARDRIAKLEPQLAYLTLEVAESTRNLPGMHVRRDGADLGVGIIGAAVPLDPGPAKIEVGAPDHESFSVTVRIVPGAHQTVLIPSLAAVEPGTQPAVVPPPVAETPPPPVAETKPPPSQAATASESSAGGTQRVVGLVVGGAGVVGVGLGTYFGLTAISKDKKADQNSARRRSAKSRRTTTPRTKPTSRRRPRPCRSSSAAGSSPRAQ